MMSKRRRKITLQDKLLADVKMRGKSTNNIHDGRPDYEVVLVTPAMALRWLEGNIHNRDLRQWIVNDYAAEMKAGRWRLTHQGIAFNINGTLIDGQHRLWAIAESGVSVKLAVTRGLPIDTQYVIDTGQARQVHDTLSLMDVALPGADKTHKMDTAILRWVIGGTKHVPRLRMSALQARESIEKYGEAVAWSIERLGIPRRGLLSAPVYAVVARAYYTSERPRLEEFCHVLRTGQLTDPADGAAIRLRETLLAIRGAGHEVARARYLKTERALRAFLDRAEIQRIHSADEETFPLPGERVVSKITPKRRMAK